MKLGVTLPLMDVMGDPATVRDLAQTAEELGYDYLGAPDHVLGVNAATRPDWGERNTSDDFFHDPFVLFGFLAACTTRVELSTQVLILPQRQTVLVAKQAASVDVLSGGRLRLGVGIGWNEEEFVGLGESFADRGRRSEEQVRVMKALWADQHVVLEGQWHRIDDVGINPRPVRGSIPLWFGGHRDVTLRRIARWGDGWIMLAHPLGETARAEIAKLRGYVARAGRDPDEVGVEVWTSTARGGPDDWRRELLGWREVGATHITLNGVHRGAHHTRIPGRTIADHVSAMRRYRDAVADLL